MLCASSVAHSVGEGGARYFCWDRKEEKTQVSREQVNGLFNERGPGSGVRERS